jgi:Predicted signal transduction protein with a C-terminal ATPase domain
VIILNKSIGNLWANNISFKGKLIIVFAFVSIIPLLFIEIFIYKNYSQNNQIKVNQLLSSNLTQTQKLIENNLQSYRNILIQIMTDEDMQLKLEIFTKSDYEFIENELKDLLRGYGFQDKYIRSIYVSNGNEKEVFYDSSSSSLTNSLFSFGNKDVNKEIYSNSITSDDFYITSANLKDEFNQSRDYFIVSHRIKNIFSTAPDLVVEIIVYKDVLNEICGKDAYLNWPNQRYGLSFIVDNDNKIVSFPKQDYIGKTIQKPYNLFINSVFNKEYKLYTNSIQIANTNWTLVNVADKSYLFNDFYNLQKVTVIVTFVAIAIVVLAVFIISFGITQGLKKIITAMKTVQLGDMDVKVNVDTKNELFILNNTFNNMMDHINNLVLALNYEKDNVIKHKTREKDAEIKALEAQINPHFLYNTLDSINWMAIDKKEYEISSMLKNLAQILRYTIDNSNKIVTVKEEAEWLEKYLYVQSKRFTDRFKSIIKFDEDILKYRLKKLLLQPFVENSIIHGFDDETKDGLIIIKGIKENDNKIKITIFDNGNGIDNETLENIRAYWKLDLDENTKDEAEHIGLYNVLSRIKLYYKNDCDFSIESESGQGTKITLIIPCNR